MLNYVPFFNQLVDSSLWEEELHVRVLFVTMCVLQDADHVVRVSDHHLRRKANLSDQQVLDGLKVLSSADRKSAIPQPYDGKRIERVEGGWMILNGKVYQDLMRVVNRRARWAKAKRDQRARLALIKAGKPLGGEKEYEEAAGAGAPEAVLNGIVDESGRSLE